VFAPTHQLFGSGFFSASTSIVILQEVQMILQERVMSKMMLFLIKDWDSFQRVMRLWRRGKKGA
jgi:hypothetical protein